MTDQAALPFPEPGGEEFTSGHSGSDTSRERAVSDDKSGRTAERQQMVMGYATAFGATGLTVVDLRDITGWHHGQASSILSTLHKVGRLERITERRDRCQVYVLPEHVGGRVTAPYNRNRQVSRERMVEAVRAVLRHENRDGMRMASIPMIEFALENPDEAIRRFGGTEEEN